MLEVWPVRERMLARLVSLTKNESLSLDQRVQSALIMVFTLSPPARRGHLRTRGPASGRTPPRS
jgi:hypothetical protein